MIINKITTGMVIQQFDTEKKSFVSQEFVAGDQCDIETTDGQPTNPNQLNVNGKEAYLPFEMVQPAPLS